MTMRKVVTAAILCVACSAARADQEGMVPFYIPAEANPASLIALSSPPIAPDGARVVARGDRFYVGDQRFRVWGMSMGFTAPSHEDAAIIARRLAQAGVNSIRFHGVEGQNLWGRENLDEDQTRTLDQFDYFLHQLAENGIYWNLNLHVSRSYSQELGLPDTKVFFDKILDVFVPQLIDAQKDFARKFLSHVNPYRKVRYADDAACGFVEINNEDSLFLWDAEERLPHLDPFYLNILQGFFNEFLKREYKTTEKFRAAWGEVLEEGEDLEQGTVKLFGADDLATAGVGSHDVGQGTVKATKTEADARKIDRFRCMMELERSYWEQMRNLVKEELGYKGNVTGTIIFGTANLWAQQNMDYIDCHAYWGHPRWAAGERWHSERWTVPCAAMTDSPHETATDLDKISGLMFYMASQQFKDKPYTNSEYNHCAPNDYQAECVPLMASFAALQDWDGIWFFMYNPNPSRNTIHWFDFDANPAKWGFMAAGAAIFRNGGVQPLAATRVVSYVGEENPILDIIKHQVNWNYDTFRMLQDQAKVTWKDFLNTRLVTSFDGKDRTFSSPSSAAPSKLTWDVADNGHGRYVATGAGAMVWMGHADRLTGDANLALEKPDFAVVTMTAMDEKPFGQSRKILVAAIKRCENTEMKFNEKRDSVGGNWGAAPVLIEPVAATIADLPFLAGNWKCQVLGPDGMPTAEVPLVKSEKSDTLVLKLSPEYKTMWYLLTAE